MRRRFGCALAVASLAAAGLAAAAFIEIDSPRQSRALLARASAATGATLEASEFRLSLLRGLSLKNVRASGTLTGGRYDVTLDRLVFEHRLLPLLRGQIAIDRIRLERPLIRLTVRSLNAELAIDGDVREVLAIALPPSVTKGGKTTGETEYVYAGTERLRLELAKRRFALGRDPEAYVFGTETGRPILSFKRLWRELFALAGLDYRRAKGLTWHTIRHEFISRNIENTGDAIVTQRLARHRDARTTQGYMHARESRVMAAVARRAQNDGS
jgi:integrase